MYGRRRMLEVLPGLGEPKYEPVKAIAFHTRSTAKFYGDDYAVESGVTVGRRKTPPVETTLDGPA
jgi:hypothetical protein